MRTVLETTQVSRICIPSTFAQLTLRKYIRRDTRKTRYGSQDKWRRGIRYADTIGANIMNMCLNINTKKMQFLITTCKLKEFQNAELIHYSNGPST